MILRRIKIFPWHPVSNPKIPIRNLKFILKFDYSKTGSSCPKFSFPFFIKLHQYSTPIFFKRIIENILIKCNKILSNKNVSINLLIFPSDDLRNPICRPKFTRKIELELSKTQFSLLPFSKLLHHYLLKFLLLNNRRTT